MKKIASNLEFAKVLLLELAELTGVFQFIIFFFILFGTICNAQLPVRMEPRHHKVFENDYVRVLDVHIVPGDTSLFHIHETPSVFIVLTNARTGSEIINNNVTSKSVLNPSMLWFDGFYSGPRIHRVWNEDTIEYHVMDVELLRKEHQEIVPPIMDKSIKIVFNEKPVRAYNCGLAKGSILKLRKKTYPLLIVGLSGDGEVLVGDKSFTNKGNFSFIPARATVTIANMGTVQGKVSYF